jgi:ribosomal protein S27E
MTAMDALHTDGNGVAGLLAEVFAVDATSMARTCQACGDEQPVGAHRAYHGAGVVLRCPSCGAIAVRIAEHGEAVVVEWRGLFRIARAAAPGDR